MSPLSLYRSAFARIVLTAALALAPAMLLISGAVTFGLAALGAGEPAEAETHSQVVREKRLEAAETGDAAKHREAAREALEGKAAIDLNPRAWLPAIYATGITAILLLLGITLAQAALVPVVRSQGALGPAHAWSAVARRFPALLRTGTLGAAVVAVGSVLLVVPGLVAALAMSFAIPATLEEDVAGRAALDRSWRLMRGSWLAVAGWWLVILAAIFAGALAGRAVPQGLGRLAVIALVRVVLLPLPLVGLIWLYLEKKTLSPPPPSAAALPTPAPRG